MRVFSASGLAPRIQENMIAYMRLFAGLPGMLMQDGETFWFVSNRKAPGDCILKARWADDGRVEQNIDELFAQVGRHVEHIDWMLFPADQPGDLGSRLEARGMPGGPGGNWLWADLSAPGSPPVSSGFTIQQVHDDRGMAEWVQLSEEGFVEDLDCFYAAYARHGYGAQACSLHYIGYQDGTPVTSATVLDAGGTASIYDLSTPPAYRRKGFGGAITLALMADIRRRGYAETWIWSSKMARSLYRTLGYSDADFGIREHSWKKNIPDSAVDRE